MDRQEEGVLVLGGKRLLGLNSDSLLGRLQTSCVGLSSAVAGTHVGSVNVYWVRALGAGRKRTQPFTYSIPEFQTLRQARLTTSHMLL